MKGAPTKPGTYGERATRGGVVRFFPLTRAMIERRTGIARGLGYVLPEQCTLSKVHGDNGRRYDCWETGETCELDGHMISPSHRLADMSTTWKAPPGVIILSWPEDAEDAAWALDKGKPRDGDAPDPVEPQEPTDPVDPSHEATGQLHMFR